MFDLIVDTLLKHVSVHIVGETCISVHIVGETCKTKNIS